MCFLNIKCSSSFGVNVASNCIIHTVQAHNIHTSLTSQIEKDGLKKLNIK